MKSILLLIALNCLHFSGICQFMTGAGGGNTVLQESQYINVKGSPYFYDDWKSGSIVDRNGKVSENLMIRYDSYRDEVQFLKDGKTLVVDPSLASEFSFVTINNETKNIENLVFKNGFNVDGYTKLGYFQVVYDGSVQFIKKVKTHYIEETLNSFGTNEQVKRFEATETEFYINKDGVAKQIGKSRKDIVTEFGSSSSQVKTYIKENKLNLKDDHDLIQVLRKFEELSTSGN